MVDCSFSPDARRALAFARSHDWGCQAYLTRSDRGEPMVADLQDYEFFADGSNRLTYITVPATISALREFGQY